jgi:hypothetical protein
MRMKEKFKDKDEESDLFFRLVLSESQIKSWFSSETVRRKKETWGGHNQNEGVVEEGGPPPPPPPPPPPRNLIS